MGCQAVKNLKFILDKAKLTFLFWWHCNDSTVATSPVDWQSHTSDVLGAVACSWSLLYSIKFGAFAKCPLYLHLGLNINKYYPYLKQTAQ